MSEGQSSFSAPLFETSCQLIDRSSQLTEAFLIGSALTPQENGMNQTSTESRSMKDRYLLCYGRLPLRPYAAKAKRKKDSLTGDIRRHKVSSRILGSREILVYLPPGYSAQDNYRYPYAILQDGQNVFDSRTAVFGVEWSVDEIAETLIAEQKMAPVVLVAVYNSPDRVIEYTPFADPEYGGGGSLLYETFLIEELIPFLEAEYSLTHQARGRAVIGSSLGGLLALHLGWTRPELFSMVGSLSPSLWWGRRGMITAMASGAAPDPRPRVWLDGGTLESAADDNDNGVPDVIDDIRTVRAVMLSKGYETDVDLFYREVEGETHDEAAWSARVGDVLTAFFPKRETWQ